MTEKILNNSKYLEEMKQELAEAIATCGPRLFKLKREGGTAYIYHSERMVINIFPEDVLYENNIDLSNALDDFLIEFSKEHVLEFAIATWQEFNKQPADVFLDWMAENHPDYKFEAKYIGPEMKDTRTKFGVYYENGEKVYYN